MKMKKKELRKKKKKKKWWNKIHLLMVDFVDIHARTSRVVIECLSEFVGYDWVV